MSELNELRNRVHATAVEKGWWEPQVVVIDDGQNRVAVQRTFGDLIALVHSEASEALEAHREGADITKNGYSYVLTKEFPYDVQLEEDRYHVTVNRTGTYNIMTREQFHNLLRIHDVPMKPEGVPSELADIIIRVLDMCGWYGIDIEAAVAEKMEYNETRSYRHGGKSL